MPWNGRSEACLLVAISALSEEVFVSRLPHRGVCGEISSGVRIWGPWKGRNRSNRSGLVWDLERDKLAKP